VVIDITNPHSADNMGLTIGHTTSAAEEIAKAIPGAQVVKAFNTVFAQVLAEGADFGVGRKVSVFVASDSAAANQTASSVADSSPNPTQLRATVQQSTSARAPVLGAAWQRDTPTAALRPGRRERHVAVAVPAAAPSPSPSEAPSCPVTAGWPRVLHLLSR
jgi:hypothetical protein